MAKPEERKVDYVVVVVNEYARESGVSSRDAFFRLRDCGAIQLLEEEYEVEHTLPLSSTIEALNAYVARKEAVLA